MYVSRRLVTQHWYMPLPLIGSLRLCLAQCCVFLLVKQKALIVESSDYARAPAAFLHMHTTHHQQQKGKTCLAEVLEMLCQRFDSGAGVPLPVSSASFDSILFFFPPVSL